MKLVTAFVAVAGFALPCVAAGERVAFFGDSITHNGGSVAWIQLLEQFRNPGSQTDYLDVGIGGDSLEAASGRLDWDLKAQNPAKVWVMFGMNDIHRDAWTNAAPDPACVAQREQALRSYGERLPALCDELKRRGYGVGLIATSPYDQYTRCKAVDRTPYCDDPGLVSLARIVRRTAEAKQVPFVDFHTPLKALLENHRDYAFASDRIHPDASANLMMAYLFARDNIGGGPLVTETSIGNWKLRGGAGWALDYAPRGLPLPRENPAVREAAALMPEIVRDYGREIVKVSGLAEGRYRLQSDGQTLGSFTAKELAAGIDLAVYPRRANMERALAAAKTADRLREAFFNWRYPRMIRHWGGADKPENAQLMAGESAWLEKSEALRRQLRKEAAPVTEKLGLALE